MSHWDLKMFPWDRVTPRFYPPGQHPALEHYRGALRFGEQHLANWPPGTGSAASRRGLELAIEHYRQKIADFEERESELKALAWEQDPERSS